MRDPAGRRSGAAAPARAGGPMRPALIRHRPHGGTSTPAGVVEDAHRVGVELAQPVQRKVVGREVAP